MNRTLYKIASIGLGIEFILLLGKCIIYLQMGDQWQPPFFLSFLVSLCAIVFFNNIIILKYFHHKNYRTVLILGIGAVLLLCFLIVQSNIMAFGNRLENLYFNTLISMVFYIPWSLGLIFSKAGERLWLKRIGVLSIIILLISIPTLVWAYSALEWKTISQIHLWTGFSWILITIFWIMNFLSELKELKALKEDTIGFLKSRDNLTYTVIKDHLMRKGLTTPRSADSADIINVFEVLAGEGLIENPIKHGENKKRSIGPHQIIKLI